MASYTDNDTMTKRSNKNGRRKAKRVPPSFASDVVGQNIRNAVSGSYYDVYVGSKLERQFFKVCGKSTYKVNSEGVVLDDGYNMSSFYYDTPEQYETHKDIVLSQEIKDKWLKKHYNVCNAAHEDSMDELNEAMDDLDDSIDVTSNVTSNE